MEVEKVDRSTRLTRAVSRIAGSLGSFPTILLAVGLVAIWILIGLRAEKADRIEIYDVLTMFATVFTFIMVFIIQNTQNREDRAVQTKLDAQAHALRQILDHLEIHYDHPLSRLAGLEEAPEEHIKAEQETVRPKPTEGNAATGPNVKQAR